jgi:ketosteroid isomerase-like protein
MEDPLFGHTSKIEGRPTTEETVMATTDRLALARDFYLAFAAGDRPFAERFLDEDFTFSSPLDVGLDRAGFFERCWPAAGELVQEFEFVRLLESGDEVVVTYVMRRSDGGRGRNTEVLTFKGEKLVAAEVYFGWEVR